MIKYRIITAEAAQEAALLISDIFCRLEPMSIRNKIDRHSMDLLMSHFMVQQVELGYSVGAFDRHSGRLAGCVTGKDFCLWPSAALPEELLTFLDVFRADMAMCHQLEKVPEKKDLKPGDCFQPFHIAVNPDFMGSGIATELARQSELIARKHGFKFMIGECSVEASKKAFLRCGFSEINYIAFDDFLYEGKPFYKGLPGGLSLIWKEL